MKVIPMKATDVLKHEHQIILVVLEGMMSEAYQIQATRIIDTYRMVKLVDFLETFVNKCHLIKEELLLFPKLLERGMPHDDGSIVVMLREHTLGRNEVESIADILGNISGNGTPAATYLIEPMLAYVNLLRKHIEKENNFLFEMADQLLTPADNNELYTSFKAIEVEEMSEGVHELYHQFAYELMKY
jgi:hemerythrin-like domain-containing protein